MNEADALAKLTVFFSKSKLISYKKRSIILRSDDTPSGIFYVKKGFVRQYLLSSEGQEFTTVIYKPGDLFPIRWAITSTPIRSYFEALAPVELWRVPREQFLDFMKTQTDVYFKIVSRILNRLDAMVERMEHLAFGNAAAKVASVLLIATERFGKKAGRTFIISLPLTHKDIASMLGMSRETVSIEIKDLERKDIIGYRKRLIVVKNLKKLRQEAMV